ncbi:hypothetical protein [Luteolibacter sp. AS25]|uniref:hypothetical protein n=1 Tax=Luteolibacter sp. AS25 TaxID=3135776 RepID=UPI00398AA3B3
MEIRLQNEYSDLIKIPSYRLPSRSVVLDERIAPRQKQAYRIYKPDDSNLESILAAMDKCALDVLFQYNDPDTGWIDMGGPGMPWEDWPDRYFIYLDCWQRNKEILEFRMIDKNGSISEFSMPNPDYVKTPEPLKAVSLPFVQTFSDLTFTINSLRRLPSDVGEHPFATFDLDISYKGPVAEGLPEGPLYFGADRNLATDEWGNVTAMETERIGKKSTYGVRLPLNSAFAKIQFQIERTRDYPQNSHSGIEVFEGTVNSTGTAIDFEKAGNAHKFGTISISGINIHKPRYNSYKNTKGKGWKELSFELRCQVPMKKYEVLQRSIGNDQNWVVLIFAEGDTYSSGLARDRNGGSGRNQSEITFREKFSRVFPPESLQPGKKIRVAIHPAPESEQFEAILALPVLEKAAPE